MTAFPAGLITGKNALSRYAIPSDSWELRGAGARDMLDGVNIVQMTVKIAAQLRMIMWKLFKPNVAML
jgi:hypothetical protein